MEIGEIAGRFGYGQCKEAALAIAAMLALRKKEFGFARLTMTPKGFIASFEYKTSRGKTKIQALICIMRRLIRIIYAMMKYKTAYEMPEIKENFIEQKIS